MEIGRILPGVATLGGKIFVVGGERGSQILANGEVYDPQVSLENLKIQPPEGLNLRQIDNFTEQIVASSGSDECSQV